MYEYEADVANFAKYFDIYNLMRISKGATADQLKKWLISEGMPETSARRHIKEFTEDYEGWLYDYDEESEEYSVSKSGMASGLKSVILYRVVGTEKTVIYGNTTKAKFSASDTNSSFDMYYEIGADEKDAAYYLIVVSDHAGNVAKKKLISQNSLLTWFHTSIERSTYR